MIDDDEPETEEEDPYTPDTAEVVTWRMSNSSHGGMITSAAERVGGVLFTRRRARWMRGYLQALSEGATGDRALVLGGRYAGLGGTRQMRDLVIKQKMEQFLTLPDVKQAMRNVYDEVGFELPDALRIHVAHIKGEFTDKNGDPIPPNYAALKDYLAATTPKEATRMHVLTARVGAQREVRTDGSPPPMASRPIGETHDQG